MLSEERFSARLRIIQMAVLDSLRTAAGLRHLTIFPRVEAHGARQNAGHLAGITAMRPGSIEPDASL